MNNVSIEQDRKMEWDNELHITVVPRIASLTMNMGNGISLCVMDSGANSCLLSSNAVHIHSVVQNRKATISGCKDGYVSRGNPICSVYTMMILPPPHGPQGFLVHEAAIHKDNINIMSNSQMQEHGVIVDGAAKHHKTNYSGGRGRQMFSPDKDHFFNMEYRHGLMTIRLRKPTPEELEEPENSIQLTSEEPWDPTVHTDDALDNMLVQSMNLQHSEMAHNTHLVENVENRTSTVTEDPTCTEWDHRFNIKQQLCQMDNLLKEAIGTLSKEKCTVLPPITDTLDEKFDMMSWMDTAFHNTLGPPTTDIPESSAATAFTTITIPVPPDILPDVEETTAPKLSLLNPNPTNDCNSGGGNTANNQTHPLVQSSILHFISNSKNIQATLFQDIIPAIKNLAELDPGEINH